MIQTEEYLGLLRSFIRIPSFSREETAAADFLESWLWSHGFKPKRICTATKIPRLTRMTFRSISAHPMLCSSR